MRSLDRRARLLGCALVLLAAAGCSDRDPGPTGLPTLPSRTHAASPSEGRYEDPELGVSLEIAPGWEAGPTAQADLQVFSPGPPDDAFRENLNVIVQAVGDPSLEEYTAGSLATLEGQVEGFQLITSEPTTFAGEPGHELVYTGSIAGAPGPLQFRQVFTLAEGKAYLVTYTAEEADYERYATDVQAMIDSFRII